MPSRRRRTDYSRSAPNRYIPYPALILDPAILEGLGLIAGTRAEETPPKVVMVQSDWAKLVNAIRYTESLGEGALEAKDAPHRAIAFLGTTWRDNPLIEPPVGADAEPEQASQSERPYRYRPKKPARFAHLTSLPVSEAVSQAKAEHEARVNGQEGMPEEASLQILVAALEAIKRAEANRVEPRPLAVMQGDDPPTPTEIRRGMGGL